MYCEKIGLPMAAILFMLLASVCDSAVVKVRVPQADRANPRVSYAERILTSARFTRDVVLTIDPKIGNPEGFTIKSDIRGATVSGGGPAGLLYGAQELVNQKREGKLADTSQKPDFGLRGNALFLMKEASYDFQLTPKEFPWFYDKALLTKYLDYLFANRFNTIFLWSGCLFPSIVEMPEYPDATDLSREQLLQNQAQFRWFTDECAKRNISVLMHFYSIQIPGPMAKARNIPLNYNQPTEFTAKLIKYCLSRFLTEFKSVGLYVCPGEALDPKYTAQWINDIVLSAAKECGHNPAVVVRDWGLDAEGFKRDCINQYENLFVELKHNIEMIVSPVPDDRHQIWRNVGRKHIVNLHEVADVKPFRWGSPTFIQEMTEEWKKAGINGAEIYSMVSWRWPYSCDKLEPQQQGFWPEGKKLITFERDWIWLEAMGRYLWKIERDPKAEAAYWDDRLSQRFGAKAGKLMRQWYERTGPILPGLQNLTSVQNMNWHPTAIGKEQTVDAILAARVIPGSKASPQSNYVSKPVDSYFFERYKREYHQPSLKNRMSMPVSEYATKLADAGSAMTPNRITALMVKLAQESLELAKKSAAAATQNREEADRFVTDSEALLLIAQAWDHKINAAIMKGAWQKTHKQEYADTCLHRLQEAIEVYQKLVELTDHTYINATDMILSLNWHKGLEAFKSDLAAQEKVLGQVGTTSHPSALPES